MTKQFVDTGKLPPVKDRLPKEPLVYKTANMPDGTGVYGDVMRHVIGGRPQGWNYAAGQIQGWGGVDIGMYECLTRTGPLFEVKASELEPMPNLAKSWDWSKDGHTLTMHLIEGAKWSDGVPFTADDVMFYWNDNIEDPNVKPLNSAGPDSFGVGTTLEKVDDYTVKWHFKDAFPKQYLYTMAYGGFCPLPAHILKPMHPKYSNHTYEEYQNAFPPDYLNFPVMGAWVPVAYRPDDIIVLRRNPYYWKVDEKGNQLPYLDEMTYKLSTWADRDVQAVAGTGDFSNLEQPESYVEALKRSADPKAPARLAFGARTIGYSIYLNFSANGWGTARRPRPGSARTEPQPRLPPGGHLGDRPGASRPVAGQGAVHDALSRRPLCRHGLLRQGIDGLLSVRPQGRQGRARQGRSQGHRRRRHRQLPEGHPRCRRAGRVDHAVGELRLPDRKEPRRRRGRRPCSSSACASSSISSRDRTWRRCRTTANGTGTSSATSRS